MAGFADNDLAEMASGDCPCESCVQTRALASEMIDLRKALEFYADKNGDGYDVMPTNYGFSTEEGPIVRDGGDIARAALAKARGQA